MFSLFAQFFIIFPSFFGGTKRLVTNETQNHFYFSLIKAEQGEVFVCLVFAPFQRIGFDFSEILAKKASEECEGGICSGRTNFSYDEMITRLMFFCLLMR